MVTRIERLIEERRVRVGFGLVAAVLFGYYGWRIAGWQGYDTPPGVFVQGAVIGGLTALIAFGIALVYRANRIVNFAQGDLGAVPAVLAILLIVGPKVPYVVAVAAGIGTAIVLGALVEFVFIRRFFRAPRLILTAVTIALAQLFWAAELVLPQAFDLRVPPQSFPSPFSFSFEIDPIVFRGNDILAMVMVPVAIAALVAFFRYTKIGIAVRASAESADRAFLLGIPVRRIQTIVWVVATLLATTAMFLRAGVVGLPIGTVLGPGILLRSLAAAVVGRMENLGVIFAASVGLGIIEQSVVWHTGSGTLVDPILFVVVLAALLLRRRGEVTRAEDAQTSSWRAVEAVRAIPAELSNVPEIKWGLRVLGVVTAGTLLAFPLFLSSSQINLAGVVIVFAIIGLSLIVLTGWAGQVSLGQMAFVGIGAAAAGILTDRFGWDLLLALLATGGVGAVAAALIGIPALRIRGLLLAVTTLAFALATSSFLLNDEYVPFLPEGRIDRLPLLGSIRVDSEAGFYYVTLGGFVVAYLIVRSLRKGRTGRALMSIRDNERAAEAYGINATRTKLVAFATSGFLAAFAGGLFVHQQQLLQRTPFEPEQSLRAFVMVVIGGLGSVLGAILGATYIWGTEYFLPRAGRFLASGLGQLVILLIFPAGLGGLAYRGRDAILRWIANRRGIVVPSLVADVPQGAEVATRNDAELLNSAVAGALGEPGSGNGQPIGKRRRVREGTRR